MSKVFLWDLDKDKVECYGCGVNCELYDFEGDIYCKSCAKKIEVDLNDPSDE